MFVFSVERVSAIYKQLHEVTSIDLHRPRVTYKSTLTIMAVIQVCGSGLFMFRILTFFLIGFTRSSAIQTIPFKTKKVYQLLHL